MHTIHNIKKFNTKKTIISTIFLITSFNAHSQWAVMDAALQKNGVFTASMAEMLGGVNTSIQTTSQTINEQSKLMERLQIDTDKRNRQAKIEDKIYNDNLNSIPTIRKCIELTQGALFSTVSNSPLSFGGGRLGYKNGGGGRIRFRALKGGQSNLCRTQPCTTLDPEIRADNVVDSTTSSLEAIADKKNIAGGSSSMAKALGLNGQPDYKFADIQPLAIFYNLTSRGDKHFTNFSSEAENSAAAQQYISGVIGNPPPKLSDDEIKRNPTYLALYDSAMTKLYAATHVLQDMAKLREAQPISGASSDTWNSEQSHYGTLYGDRPFPANPSTYEVLRFNVDKNFAGLRTQPLTTTDERLDDLIKQTSLTNKIALLKFEEQEKSNLLLSHLLSQTVTPVTTETIKAEYNKTKTTNKKQ